jgi:hypothetical protein
MQVLTRLTERHAHGLRWLLLLGWLGLIGSLLLSPWLNSDLIPGRLASCAAGGSCNLHHHDGNQYQCKALSRNTSGIQLWLKRSR